MNNEGNTYYYLKHPNHIKRFLSGFSNYPYSPSLPKINFDFPSGRFIGNLIGYSFFGFIIMLIDGFGKTSVIVGLIPVYILVLTYFFCIIIGIGSYFKQRLRYKRELNTYPKKHSEWIKTLPEYFVKYYKFVCSKVKYRYNPETRIGDTAMLLRSSLKRFDIDVKQEAELLWKGLNLLPQRPYRKSKKIDGWFKQFKYTADFIYVNYEKGIMLDIEIDERHHFEDSQQIEKDKQRNNIFLCSGWSIIRFKDSEIRKNPNKCAEDIKKVISQIEMAYSVIYMEFKQLQNINFTNNDYLTNDLSNWISKKASEKIKEYFNDVADGYDSAVDYSFYQVQRYMRDFFSFK